MGAIQQAAKLIAPCSCCRSESNQVMKLIKIKAGHYKGTHGIVRNVFDGSGAAHVRHARAKWLVTLNVASNGPGTGTFFVPSLKRAREWIA
jgi:hypothetical protein